MSSPRNRAARPLAAALLAVAAAALASCGFRPLYGEGAAGSSETLARIEVAHIEDRPGQRLRILLRERLTPEGPPAQPLYTLHVEISESIAQLAVRADDSATRANLTVVARYSLAAADAAAPPLHSATVSSTNSYNRLRSQYATLAAESDARERALRQIAEEIRLRVAAALGNPEALRPREPGPPAKPDPREWR